MGISVSNRLAASYIFGGKSINFGNRLYESRPYTKDCWTFSSSTWWRIQIFISAKTYDIIQNGKHKCFSYKFNRLVVPHRYTTRSNLESRFNTHFYVKSKCQNSFLLRSIRIWNKIPNVIKSSCTLSRFKKENYEIPPRLASYSNIVSAVLFSTMSSLYWMIFFSLSIFLQGIYTV